jgi:hypothetical protein
MKRPSLGVFPPFKSHPFHSAEELQIVSEEVRPEVPAGMVEEMFHRRR